MWKTDHRVCRHKIWRSDKEDSNISTSVKERGIGHEDYKTSLFTTDQMTYKQTRIMQREHELYTVETQKISLSPFNDKKWITRKGDTFTSYSFGHHMIDELELVECLVELSKS